MKEVLIFADVSMIEVTMIIIPARLTTQTNLIFWIYGLFSQLKQHLAKETLQDNQI